MFKHSEKRIILQSTLNKPLKRHETGELYSYYHTYIVVELCHWWFWLEGRRVREGGVRLSLSGGRGLTTCSMGKGGLLTLSMPHLGFITQYRSWRCWYIIPQPASFWSLTEPQHDWRNISTLELNKPNTCFLSGCTCSVGPRGSVVCLPCCCCVDQAFPH